MDKIFPEGMIPLANKEFHFSCHPGVDCFTLCCKNVNLTLYPYDIIRLKNAVKLDSEEFLHRHVALTKEGNPFFPTVKLKLTEEDQPYCPFLLKEGCRVYRDRPSACRTYPLERAVDRTTKGGRPEEFFFLTHHEYCRGHSQQKSYTVKSWCREQQLHDYDVMNELWAELDTIFASNPWEGEGAYGEKQQLAFLACYNIDGFRRFAMQNSLFDVFILPRKERQKLENDDRELLKFAFEWLKFFLTGQSSRLRRK